MFQYPYIVGENIFGADTDKILQHTRQLCIRLSYYYEGSSFDRAVIEESKQAWENINNKILRTINDVAQKHNTSIEWSGKDTPYRFFIYDGNNLVGEIRC